MKTYNAEIELPAQHAEESPLDIDTLVGDLLGADPADFRSMSEADNAINPATLYGVQGFMRRILQLAIQLQDQPKLVTLLKTNATAKAHGWPTAHLANIAMLFVWSMIRDERWIKGLPFARLEAARGIEADPPITIEPRLRDMSVDELVAEYTQIPVVRRPKDGATLPPETFPAAASAIVRAELRLDPMTLTRGFDADEAHLEKFFGDQPEKRTMIGLRMLVSKALSEYKVMRKCGTTTVRLMSDADAEMAERPSTRAAHLTVLLAAALHADKDHEIVIMPPHTRGAEEEAMLRAAAKAAYLDGSDEALQGLEMLVDSNVHFGWPGYSRAQRLLQSVANDVDPDRRHMPYTVEMQEFADDIVRTLIGDERAQGDVH